MSTEVARLLRLPGPRLRRRMVATARVSAVAAALLTLLAVHHLTAVTLSLFLIAGQGLVVVAATTALAVAVSDLFRRRGVSQVRFEAGETIFRQGERGDLVYAIVSGRVEVVREEADGGERLLATMGPGEYFGEMALVSDAPRTATVRAVEPVEAVAMGRADFTTLYAYLPDLRRRVESVIRERRANQASGSGPGR